jgi:hypothetical protein
MSMADTGDFDLWTEIKMFEAGEEDARRQVSALRDRAPLTPEDERHLRELEDWWSSLRSGHRGRFAPALEFAPPR